MEAKEILSQLKDLIPPSAAISIQEAIYTMDIPALQKRLESFLLQTVSFHDAVSETFYKEELTVEFKHSETELRNAREATCAEDGYTGDTYCTICGALVSSGQVIPAKGHDFPDWIIVQEPDCFHSGLRTRTCETCGETQTEVLEKDVENCPSLDFRDLDSTKWYHEGVDFVLKQGLMKGIAAQVFAPDANMTRGQLVTVLYRLAGEPETQNTYPFTDVSQTSYCAKAVAWAYENGLTKGVTGTQFAPNHPVTREQMVTFFARYALYMGEEVTGEGDLSAFTDGNQVSPYARTAMAWAVETGLIKGMGNHTVSPKGMATRAQTAAIFMRYCKIFD